MKKNYFALLTGLVLILGLNGIAFSQTSVSPLMNTVKFPVPAERENSKGVTLMTDPVVNLKVLRAFNGLFKNVSDASWYELDQKYLAKFNKGGRQSSALFSKNGFMLYTISYGNETHLPTYIRKLVRSEYLDYGIIYSAEVNSLDKTAWVIKLEDPKSIIVVKVVDGIMEETENYRKSK